MTSRTILRRQFRHARRSLTPHEQASHAAKVARFFISSGLLMRTRTVGLYLASDGELDLQPLVQRLLRTRVHLALPVVGRGSDGSPGLTFRDWRPGDPLCRNHYGIPEPTSAAPIVHPLALGLLLMPLVAFDELGTRLGMGAGYYDRFLGHINPRLRPLLIGVAHEIQRSPYPLPAAEWDVPLNGILTERGFQRLRC